MENKLSFNEYLIHLAKYEHPKPYSELFLLTKYREFCRDFIAVIQKDNFKDTIFIQQAGLCFNLRTWATACVPNDRFILIQYQTYLFYKENLHEEFPFNRGNVLSFEHQYHNNTLYKGENNRRLEWLHKYANISTTS